ncbi:MAG: DUF3127 domain-containing protein [Bacteroidales bacterium]|nr:DUF3127 domain-containing protein [Bacteroidales bacterium]MDD2424609.1 DUF3127 domain-containing protein [Bacteroidales bacterium]MDD3988717.1 DUF3127 domain-containing protein [Bacteroidales bacterium]MDD4638949.1 DUF3127 domain-containing protein [Bacteroidales bacterium]
MALEINGTLLSRFPVQSGTSARGEWSKQEFLLETSDNFRKKVLISAWGADLISVLSECKEGEVLNVSFNIESREYNQRWYTDVRAWRIVKDSREKEGGDLRFRDSSASESSPADPGINENDGDSEIDDLPF